MYQEKWRYILANEREVDVDDVPCLLEHAVKDGLAQQCVRVAVHHTEHDGYTGVVVWDRCSCHR